VSAPAANVATPAASASAIAPIAEAAAVPICAPGIPRAAPSAAVSFVDFTAMLSARIAELDRTALRAELAPIAARHGLDPEAPGLLDDFVKIRTVFEATRDGGFFRLRWAITDREPSSKEIWKAWSRPDFAALALGPATATAECDEISSLTAFLAVRLDVGGVGLFYPTWNHTIVAWEPRAKKADGTHARILLPTTQIFLDCDDAIDHTTFSEKAQSHIFPYGVNDVAPRTKLPAGTAAFLLEQVDVYAPASTNVLALIRLHRARRLSSSVDRCADTRRALATSLAGHLSCSDEIALRLYWTDELGQSLGPEAQAPTCPACASDNSILERLAEHEPLPK
jgi:hypothetical protein